ncbi:MAG: class I SAM-dependent methyltransferase [Planctomycetota bacterium]|jgi:SAM-dependent methyltransferase
MSYANGEDVIARMYAADYEAAGRVADVEFYVEEATRRGGPVAEFACGTGRVLCPTARAGVGITGIDVSPAMLAQARANLAAEGLSADLIEGDMRSVDLGCTFRVVTMPFRPFQHMVSIDDQLAALSNLRRHLEPGGALLFDVFYPDLSRIGKGGDVEFLDFERPDGEGGTVRRYVHTAGEPWRQLIHVFMRWECEPSGEVFHAEFDMRWFTQAEIEHLLARTGYELEAVYGSFTREPVGRDAQDLVFVACA